MTQIILALRSGPIKDSIVASCAIQGDPTGLRGSSKQFANVRELEDALDLALVTTRKIGFALMVVNSGHPSFIELSELEAYSLGVLETAGLLKLLVDDEADLKQKLELLEATFTSIRDHRGADGWTRGEADFGQGRIVDLRIFLSSLSKGGAQG
ncbi:hypothetical protein [Granulicella tundricola]|uniref:Uncharacterized protein n=1 Tax=Granulicella tundricola (strain ATCC BAA-1859 / DSM 23138 / MP5ACTX9) TaxID=1198114 RepID=E8X7M6_GRATM|nr:hypothetical protein [Granulicella tundricola]ADW71460.1 hypothetical protein AciX9_4519 [Granulicella tundricola MP5ACTX9]